ncbi:MAG: methylmalonyl-CoA mutase family protein [Thermaurantimonas sp.]
MNINLQFDIQTESEWLKLWMKESGGKSPEEYFKQLDRQVFIKPYHLSETPLGGYASRQQPNTVVSEWVDLAHREDGAVNRAVLDALNSGASGLYIHADRTPGWEVLFREVGLEYLSTTIDIRSDFSEHYQSLLAFLSLTRIENSSKKIFVCLPWFSDFDLATRIISDVHTDFHSILIDLSEPLEAGVPPALVLALAIEMLNDLRRIKPQLLCRTGFLTITTGNTFQDFVFNRCLRVMSRAWMKKAGTASESVFIHTRTGRSDLTTSDVYTNLVRNSIKTLTALVSGADAVTVLPYNVLNGRYDPQAQRLARNQALISIYESKLDSCSDPIAGSYSFEDLSKQLIENALGYLHETFNFSNTSELIQSSYFAEHTEQYRQKLLEEYSRSDKILVGVSKFKPEEEKPVRATIPFREDSPFEPLLFQNFFV